MTGVTSVGLVDDDPLLLQLLAASLGHEGLSVLWACDAAAALRNFAESPPSVVVIDIRMPVVSGFHLAWQVLSSFPEAKVMMLTSLEDPESLAGAMQAGAMGYLVKTDPPDRIATGIRAAASGLRAFSPAVGSVEGPTGLMPSDLISSPLTPRETEVLQLMAQSLTNDQIARRLQISGDTVKRHVSSVLGKLNVPDRLGAVMWGVRNHVIRG